MLQWLCYWQLPARPTRPTSTSVLQKCGGCCITISDSLGSTADGLHYGHGGKWTSGMEWHRETPLHVMSIRLSPNNRFTIDKGRKSRPTTHLKLQEDKFQNTCILYSSILYTIYYFNLWNFEAYVPLHVNRTVQYGENKLPIPAKRQKAFEKRVMRPTFEPKRNKVTCDWRKPHYKELGEILKYQPGDKIKVLGVACSAYGERRCIEGFCGETWRKENTWQN